MLVFLSSSLFPSPASLRTATLATPCITARGGYRLFFISTTSPTLLIPTTPRRRNIAHTPHARHALPPPTEWPPPPPPRFLRQPRTPAASPPFSCAAAAARVVHISPRAVGLPHSFRASIEASHRLVPLSSEDRAKRGGRVRWSARGGGYGKQGGTRASDEHPRLLTTPHPTRLAASDPGTTDADDAVEQAVGVAADTPYTPEAQHGADVPARAVCAVHACTVRIPVPARTVHAFTVPFCAARAVRIVPVRAVRVVCIRTGSADPIPVRTVRAPLSSQPLSPSPQCTPLLSRFALSAHR
ncbi:hypothetical protein PLICRDRAFT_174456 [Plicaturopsis crispa FD-325 SS-3]|nr:hypothetical protein PLICRDRAFT_174456 [Plicaturopsis crispa FD-325 SS-3]